MNALDAYASLRRFGKPVFTTDDVAARLRTGLPAASRMLRRLESAGLVRRLKHGLWSSNPDIDPLAVPEYLTAPLPAYVSLQSALYLHGMIGQIPRVVFVSSLASTRRVETSIATYSIHRLAPEFFGGYRHDADHETKVATPEKALLDVFYLTPARSRLFTRLPELELPAGFSVRECRRWIARIPAEYRRNMVSRRLDAFLGSLDDRDENRDTETR